jgi:hypothetical protein
MPNLISAVKVKSELRKRFKGEVLELTPELCKLIMNSGGPTFKPCGRGFRCNQTGEFVGKKTIAYANRISGIANTGTQKSFKDEEKERVREAEEKRKAIEALPFARKYGSLWSGYYLYCPNCQTELGTEERFHTWSTCPSCKQGFRV